MSSRRPFRRRRPTACALPLLVLTTGALLAQAPAAPQRAEGLDGRTLFVAQCARCHGMEGRGGEGPSLVRPTLRRAADDEALFALLQNGIPARGMPEAWQLSEDELHRLVAYVRSLGAVEPAMVAGDPQRGREIYDEQGCEACHIVAGAGFGLGPELTEIGASRGTEHLRESLVAPGTTVSDDYRTLRVQTADGRSLQGVRVNEDEFTVQLRDANRRLYSFSKTDLVQIERQPATSLMPDYGRRLEAGEIDDLVAYLASLRGQS